MLGDVHVQFLGGWAWATALATHQRGLESCYEMDDWHEAEKEIISQYRYWFRDVQ